jgi:hypothetical protein
MRTIRTPEKGERLFAKLAKGYSVTAACQAERIGRTAYYKWRKDDPDFAVRADEAIEAGTDLLEDVARKRATAATNGSDTLLMFLLKGRRPDKYRDRQETRHVGFDGGAIPVTLIRDHLPDGA